jgi:hypothetical protein
MFAVIALSCRMRASSSIDRRFCAPGLQARALPAKQRPRAATYSLMHRSRSAAASAGERAGRGRGRFTMGLPQIRAARALLKLSAGELATAASVGVATIRRAEATDGPPSMTMANTLAVRRYLDTLPSGGTSNQRSTRWFNFTTGYATMCTTV